MHNADGDQIRLLGYGGGGTSAGFILVHKPPIVILDEPTAGVDVELRSNLWKNVKELNKQGRKEGKNDVRK